MSEGYRSEFVAQAVDGWETGVGLLDRLVGVAGSGGVFGEPVTAHGQTVVTASEVMVGLGFGFGAGGGMEGASDSPGDGGSGGGGGGGGGALGRPVAVISIGEHGVHVEPVVDPTKMALAFFTALGAMFVMLGRMRRAARD